MLALLGIGAWIGIDRLGLRSMLGDEELPDVAPSPPHDSGTLPPPSVATVAPVPDAPSSHTEVVEPPPVIPTPDAADIVDASEPLDAPVDASDASSHLPLMQPVDGGRHHHHRDGGTHHPHGPHHRGT